MEVKEMDAVLLHLRSLHSNVRCGDVKALDNLEDVRIELGNLENYLLAQHPSELDVEPESFDALGLVPFQINPHYTDAVVPRHRGETRADRIAEFVRANPDTWVVGLREGSLLRIEGMEMSLLGDKEMRLFRDGEEPRELTPADCLAFLLSES